MKKTKLLLLFTIIFLNISCRSDERNRLPVISPDYIELTKENPTSNFEVSPEDYDIYGFRVDELPEIKIPEHSNQNTVNIDISGKYRATIYFDNTELKKIDFGFMILEKTGRRKYQVKKTNKTDLELPSVTVRIGFESSDGISPATIIIK